MYLKYASLCCTQDCPPDAGDFRAQQCSAHADVRYQGQYHEWLPVYNDPDNPCALKCKAKSSGLVVELAPKVLDGTRCYTESLDMCISGVCQVGERFSALILCLVQRAKCTASLLFPSTSHSPCYSCFPLLFYVS